MPPAAVWRPDAAAAHRRRLLLAASGLGGLVVLGLVIALATGSAEPTAPGAAPPVATPASVAAGGDPPDLVDARALVAAGRADEAERALLALRRSHHDRAEVHYLLGRVYFERLWWSNGMKAYRDAIRLDPAYRADPALIESVLGGFVSPTQHDAIAAFLRDEVGDAALPYLRALAADHPNPRVRQRAARALERF
jgi:eukaryotic-like serine/threonine-protein kinase